MFFSSWMPSWIIHGVHYGDVIMDTITYQITSRLFRCNSKKTSKLRVTGLRVGNSPETGEFPAQMASTAENVSICWRHHGYQTWFSHDYILGDAMTTWTNNASHRLSVHGCVKGHHFYPASKLQCIFCKLDFISLYRIVRFCERSNSVWQVHLAISTNVALEIC